VKLLELDVETLNEIPFLLHESDIQQRRTCPELPMLWATDHETV
jgi:hypothetical protein